MRRGIYYLANAVAALFVVMAFVGPYLEVSKDNQRAEEAAARMAVQESAANPLAKHAIMYAPTSLDRAALNLRDALQAPPGYIPEQVVPEDCSGSQGYVMREVLRPSVHVFMRWVRSESRWEKYGPMVYAIKPEGEFSQNDIVIPSRYLYKGVVVLDCHESMKFQVLDLLNDYSLTLLKYVPNRRNPWEVVSVVQTE